ncbi:unnamed protein product [Linum trigynum]|uniref:Uncharacterized protein n=1 Tax=Linum trigynum TaxID=586398 RepID=A0AAV2FUP3_9ROSI
MAFNNAQLHHVVVLKTQGFRNAIVHFRYLCYFRDRPIYPSFTISPSALSKYDMYIPSLLIGLGWSSLSEDQPFLQCLAADRMFYVNLPRGRGVEPRPFTTVVYNYEVIVSPELLATVLPYLTPDIRPVLTGRGEASCFVFSADGAIDGLVSSLNQAAVTTIDSEIKRSKEAGSGVTMTLLLCNEHLELLEYDDIEPNTDYFNLITPDSSSEDDILDYELPPNYLF